MPLSPQPRRPFGVIMALMSGVFVFSVIPLLMIGTILYLATYVQSDASGGMSGLEFTDMTYQPLLLPGIAALVYLLVAIWAWRGKPSTVRFIFPLITAFYCVVTWSLLTTPSPVAEQAVDSSSEFAEIASQVYLIAMVGVTVYIAWFMNRWSARAFYRGYYTKRDLDLLQSNQPRQTA
jgi:hypothetical protein